MSHPGNEFDNSFENAKRLGDARATWMSATGRELYTRYYKDMVSRNRIAPVVIDQYDHTKHDAYGKLIIVANAVSTRFEKVEEDLTLQEHPLSGHVPEIMHYTDSQSLVEFTAYRDDPLIAVREHNHDSIQFAHSVTMGLVVETMLAAGMLKDEQNDASVFKAAIRVLKNPSLDGIIDVLAVTGFAVLGSDNAPDAYVSTNLGRIRHQLEMSDTEPVVLIDTHLPSLLSLDEVPLRIAPKVEAQLRFRLKEQNQDVASNSVVDPGSLTIRMLGKTGFSRGCPVAHGTTFCLMRNYLADTLQASLPPN